MRFGAARLLQRATTRTLARLKSGLAHVIAATVVSVSLTALAEDYRNCTSKPLTEARSLERLPSEISSLLGRERAGLEGIADRGGKFNVTDVVDNKLPRRRFVLGGFNDACAVVAIEHGGRGHWFEVVTFTQTKGKWQFRERRSIDAAPTSLDALRRHVSR